MELPYIEEEENNKVTDNVITPNEFARLLGYRARQLRMHESEPVIKWKGKYNPIEIAKEEIRQRVVPLYIIREIPYNNEKGYIEETWDINDLDIRDY